MKIGSGQCFHSGVLKKIEEDSFAPLTIRCSDRDKPLLEDEARSLSKKDVLSDSHGGVFRDFRDFRGS